MASKNVERGLVVVGVDGSAHSVAALHWAARYAAATGAALRAVFAWHYPDVAGGRRRWAWRRNRSGTRPRK